MRAQLPTVPGLSMAARKVLRDVADKGLILVGSRVYPAPFSFSLRDPRPGNTSSGRDVTDAVVSALVQAGLIEAEPEVDLEKSYQSFDRATYALTGKAQELLRGAPAVPDPRQLALFDVATVPEKKKKPKPNDREQ